jgi:hypothetical protein
MNPLSQSQFNDQWYVEDLPACDTGMELLKHFADAHPESTIHTIRVLAWTDQVDDFVAADPLWQAYARHVGDCPHCNEL